MKQNENKTIYILEQLEADNPIRQLYKYTRHWDWECLGETLLFNRAIYTDVNNLEPIFCGDLDKNRLGVLYRWHSKNKNTLYIVDERDFITHLFHRGKFYRLEQSPLNHPNQ